MSKFKKSVFWGSIIVLTSGVFIYYVNTNNDISSLPKYNLKGSYSINVDDKKEVVGGADYVFLAKINQEIETIYKDSVTIETENGCKEVSDPYTKYSVTVISNIKGNLKLNNEIEILKQGGIDKNKKSIVLYEKDQLFEKNKYYIINAYAQPDGSLLVSGPNSSTLIISSGKKEALDSKTYNEYKEAYKNQIKHDRKRFKAKDEK